MTPYFDPNFSMNEFKEGAKHAAVLIANSLAEGDLDQVPTLQSPWTCFFLLHRLLPLSHQSVSTCYRRTSGLETGHVNLYLVFCSLFSKAERESLRTSLEDIQINFIYQIGIMMDDDPIEENKHTRHVEITWVAHAMSKEVEDAMTEHNMEVLRPKESCEKLQEVLDETGGSTILNYRFIREYTKGVEDSWTVNAVNHFKLMDLEREDS